MALETGTYINDLVATNPTSGDLKSQGDDHIRLIKATIKASFPNISGAVTLTHGQLSGVDTPLTGTPTAPTQSPADNSTAIATTAYVDASFVSSAYPPVSGNSGKFLTNDGNTTSWADAYTETESDAKFAPLASPTFTGVPKGPTAAADTSTTQLATTAFVTAEANLKADLASPTFTGAPLAPTATAGTNTTQIATTAFVITEANLKADLASPTLTGTPAAPTAAVGTDTTQIATTAFVQAAVMYNAYVKVSDVQTQNTASGTFTQDAWRTRTINTEDSDTDSIASIATNQITLPAGTYRCLIRCPTNNVGKHQARLYDTTGAAALLNGTSEFSGTSTANTTSSWIFGRFTLASESVLEVQHYCLTTKTTNGFGTASNIGEEVYTVAEFWREA